MSEIKVSWHLEVPREITLRSRAQQMPPAHQPPQVPPPHRSSHHVCFESPPNQLKSQRKPRLAGRGDTTAPIQPPKPTHRALAAVTKRTKEQATSSTHQPPPPLSDALATVADEAIWLGRDGELGEDGSSTTWLSHSQWADFDLVLHQKVCTIIIVHKNNAVVPTLSPEQKITMMRF